MNLPTPDQKAYLAAKPFPHAVVDGVFNNLELGRILRKWPGEHEHFTKNRHEISKAHTLAEQKMGNVITGFIHRYFQSQEFIFWLEQLTGITGLVFDCRKFGLHETFNGGSLMPHLDYTISKATGLQLRVNVILYLNAGWKPEYGGQLEFYDRKPAGGGISTVSIDPVFNRLAIFTMDAGVPAWHGHPAPLRCPEGMSRKSIALNYLTMPQDGAKDVRTIFSNERRSPLKEWLPPAIYRRIRG